MPKKRSAAQLNREINEAIGVPAWARGLDMTESRKLAARLGTVDVEAKQRTIENDRRVALPSITLRTHTGPTSGSSIPRGVSIDVHSGQIGGNKSGAIQRLLRSYGLNARLELHGLFVAADKGIADLDRFRASIVEALRHGGYRV